MLYPWEYINAVSQTIGNIRDPQGEVEFSDCSEDSETDHIDDDDNNHQKCVVCLNSRTSTWIFLPCKHAQCCMANKSKNLDNRVPSVGLQ